MLRSSLALLCLLGSFALPVSGSAQTFTQPEIGLQSAGACKQFAVRDRDSKAMVALGCMEPTRRWTLKPGKVTVSGNGSGTDASECATTDGKFASDGTNSWEPSCFGAWMATDQAFKVYPTRGTAKKPGTNDPESNVFTPSLIQARGQGTVNIQNQGQFINFDVVGGAFSNDPANGGAPNATGQLISVRQRPGPNGERPPYTWAANYDLHMAPGSGNTLSMGLEIDMNNFNQDCKIGTCIAASIWANGISGFPITAYLYGGGANNYKFIGNVTTSGATVTLADGKTFEPHVSTYKINGKYYRADYVSPTQLTSYTQLPTNTSPVPYEAVAPSTHNGVFLNGYEQVLDNDAYFVTAARTGVKMAGLHLVGVDTVEDQAMQYSMVTRQGQKLCFNNQDACWSYAGTGSIQYRNNGRLSFAINSAVAGNADYVQVRAQPAGSGAIVEVLSEASAASPLRLFGSNNGGVELNGPVVEKTQFTPPSSSSPCSVGQHAWDQNYEYRCVSANTWKRMQYTSATW